MKSYAKINSFLKIVGTRGNYHEIVSRFVLRREIYDEIFFEKAGGFALECDNENIENNIVLKAKFELEKAGFKNELDEFFASHKIVIKKQIPLGAGLGGGSSNAATFLKMANEELNLKLTRENLMKIGANIGADVAFFASDFNAANVGGIGEIISEFNDEVPEVKILTPGAFCSTPAVYGEFRANFMDSIDVNLAAKMREMTTVQLLERYENRKLNDLFAPCFKIYPQMDKFKDFFLSGSGASVFFLK
ncbi:4-(cytidine 5'-diphospho)-2-C-methyl-D-erythritol kinase [Campylobacter showae]|uniref:4-(cytidine 5'-diphospho)-2-C-methyl-D-erythritol kinase n=1 Tax=Campylobacter showae TaxID=204 RepID=UPI0028EA5BDE|nr:4-(cytidine 5'-diphospho)-2-C-methyl-D-erythritol kinase [Campylobacter showae]